MRPARGYLTDHEGDPTRRRPRVRIDMPSPLLLPVALVQGLWVRQTVPRLPPARGRRGGCGTGPHGASVVGIGDSIIAGVGVDRQEQALLGHLGRRLHERTGESVRWLACGVNGADSATILERIVPHAPAADVYVVSVGVNDAARGAGALLGERAARLQAAVRELAPRLDLVCFDFPPELPAGGFARDGFHPGSQACDEWAGWLLDAWLSRPARAAGPARGSPSRPG